MFHPSARLLHVTKYDCDPATMNSEKVCMQLLGNGAEVDVVDNSGCSPLWWACSNGLTAIAKLLIKKQADVNKTNKAGYSPLMIAARRGHDRVVDLLISKRADVNYKSQIGSLTPLLSVITHKRYRSEEKRLKVCQLLLDNGAAINKVFDDRNRSPLWHACRTGLYDVAQLILSKNTDVVNEPSDSGFTPILIAAKNGHNRIIDLLIRYGADVNSRAQYSGHTPLIVASQEGHEDTVRSLLEHNADIFARAFDINDGMTALMMGVCYNGMSGRNRKVVETLSGLRTCLDCRDCCDKEGMTALMHATRECDADMVTLLLNKGASIDRKDKFSRTALHWAYENNPDNKIRNILMDKKANKNIKDRYGRIAAQYNHGNGDRSIAQYIHCRDEQILKSAADSISDAVDQVNGNTLLHYNAMLGNGSVVNILLQNNLVADVNSRNSDGRTALGLAALFGRNHVVVQLLRVSNIQVNMQDNKGQTALHLAAYTNKHHVIETLMKCKELDDGLVDEHGNTALHSAACSLSVEAFEMLLSFESRSGADRMRTNCEHWTPFHYLVGAYRDVTKAKGCQKLFKHMRRQEYVSCITKFDRKGRNLLHLAVENNNYNFIADLNMLDPEHLNNDGLSPLHLAARIEIKTEHDIQKSMLHKIINTFYETEELRNIDHPNREGDSALMMCVKLGYVANTRLLLENGSNLLELGSRDQNVLHKLVDCEQINSQVKIYELISEKAQYCSSDRRTRNIEPGKSAEDREEDHSLAMKRIIFEFKYEHLNALQYAAKQGAFALLEKILKTNEINGIPPEILTPAKSNHMHCMVCLKAVITPGGQACPLLKKAREKSVLEFLVDRQDQMQATEALTTPFKNIVQRYWRIYKAMYSLMLIIHVVHMTVLSTIVRQQYTELNCQSDSNESVIGTPHAELTEDCTPSQPWFMLLIIWPCVNSFGDFVNIMMIVRCQINIYRNNTDRKSKYPILSILRQLIFSWVFSFAFLISTMIWVLTFFPSHLSYWQYESLALVLFVGWLYTINFISVYEQYTIFVVVLKTIVLKDVLRLGLVFVIVLLSFSLSLHTIQLRRSLLQGNADSVWFTIYSVFLQTFGADSEYQTMSMQPDISGLDVTFFRGLFMIYVFTSSVVLLNLLIAMMTKSYKEAVELAQKSVISNQLWMLHRMMQVERSFPRLSHLLGVGEEVSKNKVINRIDCFDIAPS